MKEENKTFFFGLLEKTSEGKIEGTRGSTPYLTIIWFTIGCAISVVIRVICK